MQVFQLLINRFLSSISRSACQLIKIWLICRWNTCITYHLVGNMLNMSNITWKQSDSPPLIKDTSKQKRYLGEHRWVFNGCQWSVLLALNTPWVWSYHLMALKLHFCNLQELSLVAWNCGCESIFHAKVYDFWLSRLPPSAFLLVTVSFQHSNINFYRAQNCEYQQCQISELKVNMVQVQSSHKNILACC